MPGKRRPLAERFRAKIVVVEGGCWEWTGSTNPSGYGELGLGGRHEGLVAAHRLSWELHVGPIPDGLWVLHRCDNPPCCNPDHLFLGTRTDNVRDMYAKGRRGLVDNGRRKMVEDDVRCARALREAGASIAGLARVFGVRHRTMQCALERLTWRFVA